MVKSGDLLIGKLLGFGVPQELGLFESPLDSNLGDEILAGKERDRGTHSMAG